MKGGSYVSSHVLTNDFCFETDQINFLNITQLCLSRKMHTGKLSHVVFELQYDCSAAVNEDSELIDEVKVLKPEEKKLEQVIENMDYIYAQMDEGAKLFVNNLKRVKLPNSEQFEFKLASLQDREENDSIELRQDYYLASASSTN